MYGGEDCKQRGDTHFPNLSKLTQIHSAAAHRRSERRAKNVDAIARLRLSSLSMDSSAIFLYCHHVRKLSIQTVYCCSVGELGLLHLPDFDSISCGRGRAIMLWVLKFSGLFSAAMIIVVMSPSLQSFPPALAIRSSYVDSYLRLPSDTHSFRRAPDFRNADECRLSNQENSGVCDPSLVHVAITLDVEYLRGSIAAVHSILWHSKCPESVFFHFLVSDTGLRTLVLSTFPELKFRVYYFDPEKVRSLISSSVRQALEQPLNYARNYLADLLENCVTRIIYLDSDLVVIDDVSELWSTNLGGKTIGAPEYCHANFTRYFTDYFWSDSTLSGVFSGRDPCYFNTGVMVIDLEKWRRFGYTRSIERWMETQKTSVNRIYELGSLPPFLLVFAGHVAPIEHRWNQHGLGGDNVRGSCRDLHPGPVSLLHWSGSGKPWLRLDSKRPCPLDSLWAPFDLYGQST